MNLMEASIQWANRPDDERFWTLQEMFAAANSYRPERLDRKTGLWVGENASERVYQPGKLRARALSDYGLGLYDSTNVDSPNGYFTHYSLRQMNTLVGGPTRNDAFGRIPADLAARNINWALENYKGETTKVLWSRGRVARAFTSTGYGRIWNADVIKNLLIPASSLGWKVPPARPVGSQGPRSRIATEADCLDSRNRNGGGIAIQPGDIIDPAGLYLSQQDMFAFMVNEARPINNGTAKPLYRGFFIGNSEVGDMSFWAMSFLYNTVCGNHIVWGASKVEKIRVIHRGEKAPDRAAEQFRCELTRYADVSASETEKKIVAAKAYLLGKDAEAVVDALFGKKIAGRAVLADAHTAAVEHPEDGGNCSPNSAWGMVQGMSRLSQDSKYADERVKLDIAAGKIMDCVAPF